MKGTTLAPRRRQRSLFAAAVVLTMAASGFAAFRSSAEAAPQSAPDFGGVWARRGCVPDGVTCPFNVATLPLRARTIGFMQAFDEPLAPKYDCAPATPPSLIADPYNFQIEQFEDRLVFTYEKDDVIRTIWLEGHGHPLPGVYDLFWQGHSVGRFEGAELVIETTKFPFDPTGLDDMSNLPSSTQKHVTERYSMEGDRLRAVVTTEDPLFLLGPVLLTSEWDRTDQPLILPYGCDPEISKEPLQFLPEKYLDPGWMRLPGRE